MKKIWFGMSVLALVAAGSLLPAEAAHYDLKNMTPAVQNAITERQDRYSELQSLKSSGAVGENNHGYVEVFSGNAGVQSVAAAENRDRKIIYQTIADQNNLGPSGFAVVETIFGEVQRDKAGAGEPIQTPDGTWIKK